MLGVLTEKENKKSVIKFGPAGNSESFYAAGLKHTYQVFEWLKPFGLTAYEYSFSHGIKMKADTAHKIRQESEKHGISVSCHAPYYINLATQETEKKEKNVGYLLDSAKLLKMMGGKRVVFHPGSFAKTTKEKAFDNIQKALSEIVSLFKREGLADMILCPETLGKKRQSGTLEEIIVLCQIDDMVYPTIDFGHLHARGRGSINSKADYDRILDILEKGLSTEKYQNFHSHFSHIEYTDAGEKQHRTFADVGFGPDFAPLAKQLKKRDLTPTIICESRGTMAEDAMAMRRIYQDE
jgi:deoxyribonuclease-4